MITGSGSFGAESSVEYSVDASGLHIEQLVMFESEPTVAGTSAIAADVKAFKLQLLSAQLAPDSGRFYSLAPGEAKFILNARAEGISDFIFAGNSTQIDFYFVMGGVGACPTSVSECLVSRPFIIEYLDDSGELWELDVGSATWVP